MRRYSDVALVGGLAGFFAGVGFAAGWVVFG